MAKKPATLRTAWDLAAPPGAVSAPDRALSAKSGPMAGWRVALLITGSIAAYRSPDIVRELRKNGADVHCFCSPRALDFVTPMSLEWTSGHKVLHSLSAEAEHVDGTEAYDLYLVAPATYNSINAFALGLADGIIGTMLASALGRLEAGAARIAVLPCMHGTMHNSILVDSLRKLQARGVLILQPRQEDGKDKLPEPAAIIASLLAH